MTQGFLFWHLLGVIVWVGGGLVLSLVLARHVTLAVDKQPILSNIEKIIAYKFMLPGMVLALVTGFISVSSMETLKMWLAIKLTATTFFIVMTVILAARVQQLEVKPEEGGRGFFMALHVTMGLMLAGILYLVIFKPWM